MPSARHTVQAITATVAATLAMAGLPAQAAFEGRLGNVTDGFVASTTCTSSGPGKCTYFYDTTIGVTILNNWNIGTGFWSASAAAGSAQALARSAGQAASGLAGWVLPRDVFTESSNNQITSIWNSVGQSFSGLSSQFDGVQADFYWTSEKFCCDKYWAADLAHSATVLSGHTMPSADRNHFFAIRPGDLVSAVPEPQAYLMLLLGVGVVAGVARRRRLRNPQSQGEQSPMPSGSQLPCARRPGRQHWPLYAHRP